ncbi:MAG: ComEC/Rec2 family competence protein [Eubacteriales bacterium]|nr:ComEC/Rec2 family competence protein [Eubacteriales bacterium]
MKSMFRKLRHVLIIMLFALFITVPAKGEEAFELHLLDVGQGMSTLIRAGGHYMLIDGGGRAASSFVVSYLQQQGIEKLDYVVVSHYDEDHISGIIGALHVFDCDTILAPDYQADTEIYASYLSAADASGAEIIYPRQGEEYPLGDAVITVVGPASYSGDLENDRSVAIRICYGNTSYLICGDAQGQEEEDMVNSGLELASDVYVVNHHGSGDSSGLYFLNEVHPAYALLSCSADNAYGHPALETMERLNAEGVSLYRTDKQGTITVYSDGTGLWFDQEPCNDFSAGGQPETDISSESGTEINADAVAVTYVCNLNTKKFHYEYCDSVNKMKESNKKFTNESRDSLIAQGYVPCKNCNP